jgi:hypothetical protein
VEAAWRASARGQLLDSPPGDKPVSARAVFMVDMAQFAGLVAGGVFVSGEGPIVFAAVFTKSLGLSALLEGAGLNASRVATAQLLVTSRLMEPSSDSCVPGGAGSNILTSGGSG